MPKPTFGNQRHHLQEHRFSFTFIHVVFQSCSPQKLLLFINEIFTNILTVPIWHFSIWKQNWHSSWLGNKTSTESHGETNFFTSPTCIQVPTKACSCRKLTCSLGYVKVMGKFFDHTSAASPIVSTKMS